MAIRPFINFADQHRGLFIMGGADAAPSNTYRRLKATERNPRRSLRSRPGSTLVVAQDAHSVVRYNDARYAGVTTTFKRLDTEADIKTGLSGSRLRFGKFAPSAGKAASLYVANGGAPFKVATDNTVTNWGIAAPADGFTASANAEKVTQIDSMDDSGTWTGASATLATETTIKQEGTASLKATVAASTSGEATKNITIDLSQHSDLAESADEDFIACWIRIDKPANVDSIHLQFSLGNTTFADDMYSVAIQATDTHHQISKNTVGLGFVAGSAETELSYIKAPEGVTSGDATLSLPQGQAADLVEALGQSTVSDVNGVWTRIRIPKTQFSRSGVGAETWASVQAVKWVINTNDRGSAITYLDDLKLLGETGMQGLYKYLITYYNSTDGVRSAPNPTPVEVEDVTRQSIALASLPGAPADTQVDKLEIWRTVGSGTLYFKVADQAVATTTYTDTTADAYFMDTRSSASVLEDLELPRDNTAPASTTSDVTTSPIDGRTWTLDSASGNTSYAYYSPQNRPDGVAGFVDVSEPDDPLQRYAIWNNLYVFSEKTLYRIDGTLPYIATPIVGVPGTTQPDTVVVTPVGICYSADDGPRLFDGARSVRIGEDSVGGLFESEAHEDLAAMTPVVGGYARDEYLVSDETTTLGFGIRKAGVARNLGIVTRAFWYEQDTSELLASIADTNVVLFEDGGVLTDAGTGLDYEVQLTGAVSDTDTEAYVRRFLIDIDTSNQAVTASALHDDSVVETATITQNGRGLVEMPVGVKARRLTLRLAATLTDEVVIHAISVDAYVPGNNPP